VDDSSSHTHTPCECGAWWAVYCVDRRCHIMVQRLVELMEYLVNETAHDAPTDDDKESINSAHSLAREAQYINQAFSQMCLNTSEAPWQEGNPHPFKGDLPDASVAAGGYKYRKVAVGDMCCVCVCVCVCV